MLAHNRHGDAFAILASKLDVPGEAIDVSIIRDLIPVTIIEEQD